MTNLEQTEHVSQLDRIERKLDTILSAIGELEDAAKPLLESLQSGANPIAALLSGMFKRG